MKKNLALMAVTGILTLASCGQNNGTSDTTGPSLTFTATPATNVAGGATVALAGTVSDTTGVKSVVITSSNGGPVCTPVITGTNFTCNVTMPSPTASTTYNYTATATDTSSNANTTSASATVQVNGTSGPIIPGDTTHVLTVKLTGVTSAPITIKDANGAIVAGYNAATMTDGGTVTLPAGKYTIIAEPVNGYSTTTPSLTADLSVGDATVTLNYAKNSTAGANGEAYYVDADGVTRHYFDFANTPYDPSKFRFSAWLQDRANGVVPANAGKGGAGLGSPTAAEQYEWAPVNHQNILGAYMEYNDEGTWRPVVNAQVVMNIQPESQNVIPAIRFTAADDVNRSTPPITMQGIKALNITSNGFTSTSWTNSGKEAMPIGYPVNSQYPVWNVTGVGVGPDGTGSGNELEAGYTWAALMNDPIAEQQFPGYFNATDSLDARVQVVGYVNGQEIGKQWVTKRFIPTATVTIEKQLWAIDPVTKAYVTRLKGDGTDAPLLPGQEAGLRIVVTNTGQAVARNIAVTEAKSDASVADKTYSIGMTPAEYSRLTAAGVTFNSTLNNGAQQYTFANQQFSATIASLAAGASEHIDFVGTALNNGNQFCDTATLGDYLNNPLAAPDSVTGTTIRLTPLYGTKTSKACFVIEGTPNLNIAKKITLLDKNGNATTPEYDNNPMDGANKRTTNRGQWVDVAITVSNNGTQTANNILISDRLNGTSDAVAHSISIGAPVTGMTTPTAAQDNDGLDYTIPTLGAGQEVTYHYRARANADGTYCDTASITSADGSAVSDRNSGACFTVAMADLRITKTNDPLTVQPGSAYNSTITVRNMGTSDAYDVNVFDLLGLGQTSGARVTFVNGRYTITTDENLPFTGPRGVANAGETLPGGVRTPVLTDTAPNGTTPTTAEPSSTTQAIVTNPPAAADQIVSSDGVLHGLVIPAGGSLSLNVVSQIPATAPVDNYCDIGVVTANTENLVSNINRATACVGIQRIYAIQPQFDDTTDPIAQGASTDFQAVAYNEAGSTDSIYKNVFDFNIGSATAQSNAAASALGTFTTSNLVLYYDTAPSVINGTVVFNAASPTLSVLPASAYTVTGFGGAKFNVTVPSQQIVPGGAIFVKFTGTSPVTGAATSTSYNSYFDWTTTTGVLSNVTKNGNSAEDTTVRGK